VTNVSSFIVTVVLSELLRIKETQETIYLEKYIVPFKVLLFNFLYLSRYK